MALKREVAAQQPGWQASYQRKGFVTFKVPPEVPAAEVLDEPLACALRLCLSLGRYHSRGQAEAAIISEQPAARSGPLHFLRTINGWMEREAEQVEAQPVMGEWVGTILQLGEDECWAGIHRHERFLSGDPGGASILKMPEESPSRAWLKLEEAVRFLGIEFYPGEVVAEVGCAPGGVVLALLGRGVSVIGVDPAGMAEVLGGWSVQVRPSAAVGQPWFYHCRKPAALVSKRDLGGDVSWFMSDMNQAPEVVLAECGRFCKMAPTIRQVLITLKLRDLAQITEKPKWFAVLAALGFRTMRLQQFSVHHKEFALYAAR